MSVEPEADFVVTDERVLKVLEAYRRSITEAEESCGFLMVQVYGEKPEHAMTMMCHAMITRAASLAACNAIAYLKRDPDPVRWREATDAAFAAAVSEAKRMFAVFQESRTDSSPEENPDVR